MKELLKMMAEKHTVLTVTKQGENIRACLFNTNPQLSRSERVSVSLEGTLDEVSSHLLEALQQEVAAPLKTVVATPKTQETPKAKTKPASSAPATPATPEAPEEALDWD